MKNYVAAGLMLAFLPALAFAGWNAGGGGTGGGVKYSHATDCPNAGFVASPLEACVEQDDGNIWTCKSAPTGGTLPGQCDVSGDWLLGSASASAGVTTWNARAGVVIPLANDYTAAQVTNTPNVPETIAGTTVQTAINEVAAERQIRDTDLTAIANLVCTDGLILKKDAGAWTCQPDAVGGVTESVKVDINVIDADNNWTIVGDAVTNPKLDNMPPNTLKGRVDAGFGDPQDLNPAQARQVLNVADGANNYVHPNHSGDVISLGDGGTTIQNNKVTNQMLLNVPSQTMKGRSTGGTGSPEDLDASAVAGILNSQMTTQGEFDAHLNDASDAHMASSIGSQTTTTVSATNVQAAIAELDSEKQVANGNLSTIGGLICTSGQPLEYTGTAWSCGTDDTGDTGGITTGVKNDIQVVNADNDWQIVNGKVINSKLGPMAQGTIKGRTAGGGTGSPQDLIPSQVAAVLDTDFALQTELNAHTGAAAGAHAASAISNAPAGNIAATTIQAAVNELDTEKQISDSDLTEIAGEDCANGQILKQVGGVWDCATDNSTTGIGSGDVIGPALATDNAVARFDTASGKAIKNSVFLVDNSGNASTPGDISAGAGTGKAGAVEFTEGTFGPDPTSNKMLLESPADILFPYRFRIPDQPGSGVLKATNVGGIVTTSFGALNDADLANTGFTWSDYQPINAANLTQISGLACTDTQIIKKSGVNWTCQADGGGTDTGTPGGSSAQLQYNNAGAFGGVNGLTWNGTTLGAVVPMVDLSGSTTTKVFAASAGAAPTAANDVKWDTTDARIKVGDGTVTKTVAYISDIDATTGVTNLTEAFNGGSSMVGASTANPFMPCLDNTGDGDCNDAADSGWRMGSDAATGPFLTAFPAADQNIVAPVGNFGINFRLDTPSTAGTVQRVAYFDPLSGKLKLENDGKWVKSVEVEGAEFGVCSYTQNQVTGGKPRIGTFTCSNISSDGFDLIFTAPDHWDLGQMRVKLGGYSTTAQTGNVALTCAAFAVSDGEVIQNRATAGAGTVTLGFTAAEQEETSTALLTVQNTPVAGDKIYMNCMIVPGSTTITTIANIRLFSTAKVYYQVTGASEKDAL